MHASQWAHHHTFVVVTGMVIFAAIGARQFSGHFIGDLTAQASGPVVDMSISNTVLPAQATPGSMVTFFYYYQNESYSFNGEVPSVIDISADIPAGLTFVDSTPAPTTTTNATLLRNNVSLTDGVYGFIIVEMQVNQTPPSVITQTVNLAMPNNTDEITYNNSQSSQITIEEGGINSLVDVDLSIVKSGPQVSNVGGTINYTINYENIGTETATNVSIIDVIPAGTQFIDNGIIGISTSPQVSTITGEFDEVYIWNIPSLTPGQRGSISLSATVTPGLPDGFGLFNVVQINSDQNDTGSNNFDYVSTTVQATGADIAIIKSATVNSASIGNSFQYNMVITNNGPEIGENIIVTDTLPAGLTIVSATGATVVGNTYTRNIAQLPIWSSTSRSLTVQATAAGTISNSVQVSAATFDPVLANNSSTFPVNIAAGNNNGTGGNNNGTGGTSGGNTGGTGNNGSGSNNSTGSNSGGNGSSSPVGSTTEDTNVEQTHGSAEVSEEGAKACIYEDAQYVSKGPFTDTLGHRGFPYIEMMRVSCIHRGPGGKKGLWIYEPNRSVTRAEVLKTVVKILGIQFANFEILHEDLPYRGDMIFTDTPNWFNHYAQYAYNQGLTDGLYTTDKNGNKYLSPDKSITRYEGIKIIMLAYAKLQQSAIETMGSSVLGDVINPNDPYYSYVRQAETLGFISGVPQNNGGYNFEGLRNITRSEFAKIASLPFSEQLFDIAYIVEHSSIYQTIVQGIQETTMDKIRFANIVLQQIDEMPEEEFLSSFKVSKDVFMDVLTEKVLSPLLE